jgi:hypothetical protein
MSVYQQHKPGSSDGLYLKLADGDKVKGRIASEPAISVYKEGDKPRYSWIIFVREFNGKTVNRPQILTKGISVYTGIADLVEEWGEPTEFDVVIKRTGAGLNDTEYSVTPVRTSPILTKEQLAEAAKIDLCQAIKGKLLSDYVEDGTLPDPVTSGEPNYEAESLDKVAPVDDEPITLDDIPF